MALTDAQLTTLGNHIRANADAGVVADLAAGNLGGIVDYYNSTNTAVFIFVANVSVDEVRRSLDWDEVMDSVNGLTDLQRWGFDTLMHNGTYDPGEENNRDALVKIFPAGMPNTRAAVLADATRNATYAEALFIVIATGPAGGNGSSQNNSAIAPFQGDIDFHQVDQALELTA